MLFAESSGGGGAILVIIILALGLRKICTTIKTNEPLRGAAKRGVLSVLGRMFKK
jgi:hypothetical protein